LVCEILFINHLAIDFTSSNGDPRQPNSLHFRQNGKYNDYQSAIRSIGDILDNYDSDHRYPVYGYGGKLPPNYQVVSHCFNANMNPYDPYVQGVDGILQAYDISLNRYAFQHVTNIIVLNYMDQQTLHLLLEQ
jgi:hypothetical protein